MCARGEKVKEREKANGQAGKVKGLSMQASSFNNLSAGFSP